MSYNSENYKEQGAQTINIGGEIKITSTAKVLIDKGAQIQGLGISNIISPVAVGNSTAVDLETLKVDFNSLLAKLREAGILKV